MTKDSTWYSFRNAVAQREFVHAEQLLADCPSLPDIRNGIGETVLHFIAIENDIEGVKWLHAHGFSLDARNEFGIPTIFEIAQLEYRELFEWFLQMGVNFKARDNEGNDIVSYLRENDKRSMAKFVEKRLPNQAL